MHKEQCPSGAAIHRICQQLLTMVSRVESSTKTKNSSHGGCPPLRNIFPVRPPSFFSKHFPLKTGPLVAFPDPYQAVEDLTAFAKLNEARLYKLMKTCLDPQTDLKSLVKATVSHPLSILTFEEPDSIIIWHAERVPEEDRPALS